MKKLSLYTILSVLALSAAALASRVTNVSLTYEPEAVVARITVDGAVRFSHQTEVPKNGRPDRLIVDVLSATHHLGRKNFEHLNVGPITAIRTSQFAVKPEQVVRVVFDLTSAPVYQIRAEGRDVVVTLSDKKVKPFAAWSTRSVLKTTQSTKPVTVAQKLPAVPVHDNTGVDARAANKKINDDRMLSIAANPTPAAQPPAKIAAKKSVRPVSDVTKKKIAAVTKAPAKKAKPAIQKAVKSASRPAGGKASSSQTKKTLARYQSTETKPVTVTQKPKSVVVKKAPAKVTSGVTAKKSLFADKPVVKSKPADKSVTKPSSGSVAKPVANVNKPAAKIAKTNRNAKQAAPKRTLAVKKTTKSVIAPKPGAAKKSVAKAKAKPNKASSPKLAAKTPEISKAKAAKKKQRSTARFRRSAKLKKTMVAEFPKRLVIQYKRHIGRDPFASLLQENAYSDIGPIEKKIPNVEGVKLVGTIESEGDSNRALLEDKEGYSYILKAGDKVRNGYVLRVEKDKVYFQIFEYGWSRTVALAIEEF